MYILKSGTLTLLLQYIVYYKMRKFNNVYKNLFVYAKTWVRFSKKKKKNTQTYIIITLMYQI
jgi:hypothetical protein